MPMATRGDLLDPTDLASPADAATLRPEQRLAEVTVLLAEGVIRVRTELAAALPRCRCRPPRCPIAGGSRRASTSKCKHHSVDNSRI
jgi:hypothetical protein